MKSLQNHAFQVSTLTDLIQFSKNSLFCPANNTVRMSWKKWSQMYSLPNKESLILAHLFHQNNLKVSLRGLRSKTQTKYLVMWSSVSQRKPKTLFSNLPSMSNLKKREFLLMNINTWNWFLIQQLWLPMLALSRLSSTMDNPNQKLTNCYSTWRVKGLYRLLKFSHLYNMLMKELF